MQANEFRIVALKDSIATVRFGTGETIDLPIYADRCSLERLFGSEVASTLFNLFAFMSR